LFEIFLDELDVAEIPTKASMPLRVVLWWLVPVLVLQSVAIFFDLQLK